MNCANCYQAERWVNSLPTLMWEDVCYIYLLVYNDSHPCKSYIIKDSIDN